MKSLKDRLFKIISAAFLVALVATFTATGVSAFFGANPETAAFALSGGVATETDDYYTVTPTSDDYDIEIPVSGVDLGADAIVTISVYIEGEGLNGCGYSTAKFVSVENYVIDDVLPTEKWCKMTAQTKVLFDGEKPYVKVTIKNAENEKIRISNTVKATNEGVFGENILGGTTLYMLPCKEMEQNCSYVIVTANGSLIVYDGGNEGDAEYLVDFLYTFKSEVDYWFISHLHGDHLGALSVVLKNDWIKINNFYHAIPEREVVAEGGETVTRWYDDIMNNIYKIGNVVVMERGTTVTVDDVTFTALNSTMNISHNWGNNTTIAVRMSTPGEDVLFLGDAGYELGEWLVQNEPEGISGCAIVQVAHHGQNGCNQAFYQFINSKIWLVPAPNWLWYCAAYDNTGTFKYYLSGEKTYEIREWLRELEVVYTYVAKDGLTAIK